MTPPPRAFWSHPVLGPELRAFHAKLAKLILPAGSRVSGWWRTPESNASSGGREYSQHLLGLAIDIVTPNPRAVIDAASRLGLIAIYHNVGSGWHVHVQARPAGFVRQLAARAADLWRYITGQAYVNPPSARPPVIVRDREREVSI